MGSRKIKIVAENALSASRGRLLKMWVNPALALPRPAATALAEPTMCTLNMAKHQNWQATKETRLKPMHMRITMKSAELVAAAMQKVATEASSWSDACAVRGPSESHATPVRMGEKAALMTEATAAAERSAS
jgi:hypothetical protein